MHGDAYAREARSAQGSSVIDFSVNINPLGSTPAVVEAARGASLLGYPDPEAREACAAIADAIGARPSQVMLGHGATELLWLAISHLAPPDAELAIFAPTFTEPLRAAAAMGRPTRLVEWWPFGEHGERLEPPTVDWVGRAVNGSAIAYLCTPNNPTGHRVAPAHIRAYAEATPSTLWIVDEAFVTLSTHPEDATAVYPDNVLRLRSLTKDHGVPGLRIAYALADESVIVRLQTRRPPWSTSSMTQAAAIATTQVHSHIESVRRSLLGFREALDARLREHGLRPFPSSTIFSLVPLTNATQRCRVIAEHYGILLRDAASFGLEDHIRLVGRPESDQIRLCRALDEMLSARA